MSSKNKPSRQKRMDNRHKNSRKGDKNFRGRMYKADEIIAIIEIQPFERAWYSFLEDIPRIRNKFIEKGLGDDLPIWLERSKHCYIELSCNPEDFDWDGFSAQIMQMRPFREWEESDLTGSDPYVIELFNKLKKRGYVSNTFDEIMKKERDYHENQEPYDRWNRFHGFEWTPCDTYSPVTIYFQN